MSNHPAPDRVPFARAARFLMPRRHWKIRLLLVACTLFLSGCAIVPVHPGGGLVALISAVALALAACGGGSGGGGEDGEAPSFSVADASATEGDSEMAFTVTRGGGTGSEVTVDYSTSAVSPSAADSRFFTATSGTLTFASGETQKTVAVSLTLADDDELQLRDPIGLTLNNPSAGSISDGSAAGVVVDNDNLIRLASWDGTFGTRLDGQGADHEAGHSVNAAGDIDGDGVDDLVVGSPETDDGTIYQYGRVHVVLGAPTGASASLSTVGPAGTLPGFTVTGDTTTDWRLGTSVAGLGDIDGDGFGELGIGSLNAHNHAEPVGYYSSDQALVFKGSGNPANIQLTDGGEQADWFVYHTYDSTSADAQPFNQFISPLGDFDGDGTPDFMVSDDAYGGYGGVAILSGNSGTVINTHSATSGTDANWVGFFLTGVFQAGRLADDVGEAIAPAGDVDGDGYADALVGATNPFSGTYEGRAFLIFGGAGAFDNCASYGSIGAVPDGGTLSCPGGLAVNAPTGIEVIGENSYDDFGASLAAGDVNGDGNPDLIIGAPEYGGTYEEGRAYVIFGDGTRGFNGLVDSNNVLDLGVQSLDGSNGFTVTGTSTDISYTYFGDRLGSSVAAVDLNGDGADEVVIGAPEASTDNYCTGEVVVLWGGSSIGSAGNIDAASMTDLAVGVRLYGSYGDFVEGCNGDELGAAVARAGDINDDGLDDALLGAPRFEPAAYDSYDDHGAAYLVFGADIPLP